MDRLSHWWVAAWVAVCLSALAVAAALVLPAAFRSGKPPQGQLQAEMTPRTHLFGQKVSATLELPAGSTLKAQFTPYQVVARETTPRQGTVRYRFVLQCLGPACVGAPGAEHAIVLPTARITLPGGKRLIASWPPLQEASRLGPLDLTAPHARGAFTIPDRSSTDRSLGLALAVGAGVTLLAAALLGAFWLAPRRFALPGGEGHGRGPLSELRYALVVAGLAAGGGAHDRRAALESLALALDQQGHDELASRARSLAWSPGAPRGEAVRELAASAQAVARDDE